MARPSWRGRPPRTTCAHRPSTSAWAGAGPSGWITLCPSHESRQAIRGRPRRPARRGRRRGDLPGHDGRDEHLHGRLPRPARRAVAAALPRELRERGLHALRPARGALGRPPRGDGGDRPRRHGLRPAARDAHPAQPLRRRGGRVRCRARLADGGLRRGALGRALAPEVVTTARMRGERLGPRHLDAVAPMLADPRVGATMGGVLGREQVAEQLAGVGGGWGGGGLGREQVAEQLAELDGKWERDGFGYYMWFETATGAPVARGGLSRAEFDGRPEVELGWLVTPARWGEGLGTEVGAAAVEVAFGPLGLDDVVAFTLPDNVGSRRVMEKLGFVYEKTAPYKIYGDHVLYRRRRGAGDAAG